MLKFDVLLARTATRRCRLEVEAPDAQAAEAKARAQQGNINFFDGIEEGNVEYGIEEINAVDGPPKEGCEDNHDNRHMPIRDRQCLVQGAAEALGTTC